MGKNTSIEWCDHSFNTWSGCSDFSTGCLNCYARAMARRFPRTLGVWGPKGSRVLRSEKAFGEVLLWDGKAGERGVAARVFAHSNSDWLDQFEGGLSRPGKDSLLTVGEVFGADFRGSRALATLDHARARLMQLIAETKNLEWMLLTKRISKFHESMIRVQEILRSVPLANAFGAHDLVEAWLECGIPPSHVRLGVSVEDMASRHRIEELVKIPAVGRFLSCEPLLEDVSSGLEKYIIPRCEACGKVYATSIDGDWNCRSPLCTRFGRGVGRIDQIIVGGESGPGARRFNLEWARRIKSLCDREGSEMAFFMKQVGANPGEVLNGRWQSWETSKQAGQAWEDLPEDLQVRDHPNN